MDRKKVFIVMLVMGQVVIVLISLLIGSGIMTAGTAMLSKPDTFVNVIGSCVILFGLCVVPFGLYVVGLVQDYKEHV